MDHHSESPDHHCIYDDLFESLCLQNKDELKLLMEDLCTARAEIYVRKVARCSACFQGIPYRKINEMTESARPRSQEFHEV